MAVLPPQASSVRVYYLVVTIPNRFSSSLDAKLNPGHIALAVLNLPDITSRIIPAAVSPPLHVTQNIDELSSRSLNKLPDDLLADSQERLLQMHGSLFRTRCLSCKKVDHSYNRNLSAALGDVSTTGRPIDIPVEKLPRCGGDEWSGSNRYGRCGGLLRPDVVWFGEVPPLMGEIARQITKCDLLIIVGTSALVRLKCGWIFNLFSAFCIGSARCWFCVSGAISWRQSCRI